MGKSLKAETLGVHAAKRIVEIVKARGEAIGQNKSRFAAGILEWWVAQGCPAINRLDETMRAEVMAKFAAQKPSKKAG